MALAANLKRFRMRKGKTLQEVADAVGVTKPYIWQLEREGKEANPTYDLLRKLAEYFETDVSVLLEEDEKQMMVFGRKFKSVDPETERLVVQMAERLIGQKKDE